jgi:hypothetical protein
VKRLALALLLLPAWLCAQKDSPDQRPTLPMMMIEMETGDTRMECSTAGAIGELGRWLDFEAISLSTRYRHVENFVGATIASNVQYQAALKGTFRFDTGGRFTVHAGLFTGNSFTSGWNNTALGTGRGQSNLHLKQLFFAGNPLLESSWITVGSNSPVANRAKSLPTITMDTWLASAFAFTGLRTFFSTRLP